VQVNSLTNVLGVSAGENHSMAVRKDGAVYTWGGNAEGQLGDGGVAQRLVPGNVADISTAISVAAGDAFSLVLTNGGFLYAWGDNADGRLGDGSTTDRLTKVMVSAPSGTSSLAALGQTPSPMQYSDAVGTGFVAKWLPVIPDAITYYIDVAEDREFTRMAPGYDALDLGLVLEATVTGLLPYKNYSFRVWAGLLTGQRSNLSDVVTVFGNGGGPPVPMLLLVLEPGG
jgi:hypothetical protein